ncbi:MAG: hypothetical protein ABI977_01080 [Acidobacteriota bacterium]
MNNRNTVKIIVAILITFLLNSALLAQASREVGQARERITREVSGRTVTVEVPKLLEPTQANFDRFQGDLLAILNAQRETAKLMNLAPLDRLDSAILQVAALKLSDIGKSQIGMVDMSQLKDAVLEQKGLMAQMFANRASRTSQFSPTDPFPGAGYSVICPLNPQPPEVAFAAGFVLLAAELVRDIALRVCEQTQLVLGIGGNTRLLCIITDTVYFAAQLIYYPIKFCHDDTPAGQVAGSLERAQYIHDQLTFSVGNDDTNKALLSTQLTNAENHVVTNDNNNKAALSSQTAAFQTLAVRMAMEANLADDPAKITGNGLFQLPASQGGYLEVARQILIDIYNAHVAAAGPGVTIYNPASDLSLGATFTAQGKYREAYYYYCKGYRSVVKYP